MVSPSPLICSFLLGITCGLCGVVKGLQGVLRLIYLYTCGLSIKRLVGHSRGLLMYSGGILAYFVG